ncbi:MAG: hypothetical protein IJ745_03820 [Bacteroidales bacterium]|nr:hypothetical protein [Bacteroidales bacterium]
MKNPLRTALLAALLLGAIAPAEAQHPLRHGRRVTHVVPHRHAEVRQRVAPPVPVVHAYPSGRPDIYSVTEIGYTFGQADFGDDGRITLSHSWLGQASSHLALGVGAGVNFYTSGYCYNVPLFGDIRLDFSDGGPGLFADCKIGYSLGDVAGFYLSPSVGLRMGGGMCLSVGYELQRYSTWTDYGYGYDMLRLMQTDGLTVRLAFEW